MSVFNSDVLPLLCILFVVIGFVIIVFGFVRGFNELQVNKHTKKLEEMKKREEENDKTTTD